MVKIEEICDLLSVRSGSLVPALRRVRGLLMDLHQTVLAEWVDCEINGYPPDVTIPAYRRLQAEVFANIILHHSRVMSHPMPVLHLTREQRDQVSVIELSQPVRALEELRQEPEPSLKVTLDNNLYPMLSQFLTHGAIIELAWSQTDRVLVEQVLFSLRSRLLDFIHGLRDRIGERQGNLFMDTQRIFKQAIYAKSGSPAPLGRY